MASAGAAQMLRDPTDYGVALGIAFALPLCRYVLDHSLFKPIGRRLLASDPKKSDEGWTADHENRLFKWKESCWKAVAFSTFAILAFFACKALNVTAYTNAELFFEGCSQLPCEAPTPFLVRILYMVEMGFYIQAIPVLVFWEVRRKDFLENMAHHWVTLALIVYSHYLGLTKTGAVVFLLHDVNDIFMECAKMARYTGVPLVPDVFFVIFMLSWIATRCIAYPLVVIRATLIDCRPIAFARGIVLYPHYHIFNVFLITLLGLHIYWSYLIYRIVKKVVMGNGLDDVREEEDD